MTLVVTMRDRAEDARPVLERIHDGFAQGAFRLPALAVVDQVLEERDRVAVEPIALGLELRIDHRGDPFVRIRRSRPRRDSFATAAGRNPAGPGTRPASILRGPREWLAETSTRGRALRGPRTRPSGQRAGPRSHRVAPVGAMTRRTVASRSAVTVGRSTSARSRSANAAAVSPWSWRARSKRRSTAD